MNNDRKEGEKKRGARPWRRLPITLAVLLMLAGSALAAYSPTTGDYQATPGSAFHVIYSNELRGWNGDDEVYYYQPGTNKWTHMQGGQVVGTITLNSNGSFTASGTAAPPSSGSYARIAH